jgi:acetyltransferase-like isoleucine patch superfamily enzyme
MKLLRKLFFIFIPMFKKRYLKENSKVHWNCGLSSEDKIKIGEYVYIGPKSFLNGEGGITIGDGSILASYVAVLSSSHNYRKGTLLPYDINDTVGAVHIGKGVWLGYGVIICPGVNIGDGAVVGAGSVVSRNIEKGEVVAGNPVKNIRFRPEGEVDTLISSESYFHKKYWNQKRQRIYD